MATQTNLPWPRVEIDDRYWTDAAAVDIRVRKAVTVHGTEIAVRKWADVLYFPFYGGKENKIGMRQL